MDIRGRVLWWAAKRRLLLDQPFVIGVTGSIAKTSTKEAIGAVVRMAFPEQVRIGHGNLNTLLGVPLAILGFRYDFHHQNIKWQWPIILLRALWRSFMTRLPRYLIIELGADKPGDLQELVGQVSFDIAVLTMVGPAHLKNYRSVEDIAREKQTIFKGLKKGGIAFIHSRDPFAPTHQEVLKKVKVHIIDSSISHLAESFARAVGKQLKIKESTIDTALATFRRPTGRFNIKKCGSWTVIDDSYNANPLSMQAALEVLQRLPGRKVAIVGAMAELGKDEVKMHREVGKRVHEVAQVVIGVGGLAREYKPKEWFPNSTLAAAQIFPILQEGDSILVKGSRSVEMERVVEAIVKRTANK